MLPIRVEKILELQKIDSIKKLRDFLELDNEQLKEMGIKNYGKSSKKILLELYYFLCSKNNIDSKHENISKTVKNIAQGIQSIYDNIRVYEFRE